MDLLLKILAYVVFILGSLYFFFGRSNPENKQKRKHSRFIMLVSIVPLSYYYWFSN
ncbi:hypothetical protein [Metabacillus endolithicus]|uniref:hypothetical protein n=1 Tax=Metabacillus endolithicus TaxID=1535204 RepID=UPI001FFB533B|nr:hypothetical protein [Metabacillus endolithicus]UPG63977.1 hypothetical protein MVE64_02225 [Metabacillus endolithicus]